MATMCAHPQPDRPAAMSPAASGPGQPHRESSARRERLVASGQANGRPEPDHAQRDEPRPVLSWLRRVGLSLLAATIGLFALSRQRS